MDNIEDRLIRILETYSDVFRFWLSQGLPLKWTVDHCITFDENKKVPEKGLFQLFPAELLATKEHIADFFQTGKIKSSIYPYSAPLFSVNHKNEL